MRAARLSCSSAVGLAGGSAAVSAAVVLGVDALPHPRRTKLVIRVEAQWFLAAEYLAERAGSAKKSLVEGPPAGRVTSRAGAGSTNSGASGTALSFWRRTNMGGDVSRWSVASLVRVGGPFPWRCVWAAGVVRRTPGGGIGVEG